MINTPPQIGLRQILDIVYPIGAILEFDKDMTETQVSQLMLGQTWKIYGEGRVTVCKGGTSFTTVGGTTGEESHSLSEAEMPYHTHGLSTTNPNECNDDKDWVKALGNNNGGGSAKTGVVAEVSSSDWNKNHMHQWLSFDSGNAFNNYWVEPKGGQATRGNYDESYKGNSDAHNNIQPSIVVTRWHRTA